MKTQNNFNPIEEQEKRGDDWDATYTDDSEISPVESETGPDDIIDTDVDEENIDDSDTQSSI